MYDFTKSKHPNNENELLSHPSLDFECKVNKKTGEVFEYPLKTKKRYKGQEFELYRNCLIGNGSIHKYWQNGENWRDFDLVQVQQALSAYCLEFNIEMNKARLQNLEYGLNIKTSFAPTLDTIKKMFISYKGKPFEFMESKGKGCIGVVCKFSQFQIKIYSKTLQYGLEENILRIEIKVKKMQRITRTSLYLSDLLDIDFIKKMQFDLLQMVKDLIVYDSSLKGLNDKDSLFLLKVSNPNYWSGLSRMQRTRAKEKYNNLVIHKSNTHIHKELLQSINDKNVTNLQEAMRLHEVTNLLLV